MLAIFDLFLYFFVFMLFFYFFNFNPFIYFYLFFSNFYSFMVSFFDLGSHRSMSSFLVSFLFSLVFFFLFFGFLPRSLMLMTSFKFLIFLSLTFWLGTFFFLIMHRWATLVSKGGWSFFMNFSMFLIEVVSIFMKPFSLFVRLYANVMFGHFLLEFLYSVVLSSLGPFFYFLIVPFFLFELAVFLVQSYIFSFLVTMYLSE